MSASRFNDLPAEIEAMILPFADSQGETNRGSIASNPRSVLFKPRLEVAFLKFLMSEDYPVKKMSLDQFKIACDFFLFDRYFNNNENADRFFKLLDEASQGTIFMAIVEFSKQRFENTNELMRFVIFFLLRRIESNMINIEIEKSPLRKDEKNDLTINGQSLKSYFLEKFGLIGLFDSHAFAKAFADRPNVNSAVSFAALAKLADQDPTQCDDIIKTINLMISIECFNQPGTKPLPQLTLIDKKLYFTFANNNQTQNKLVDQFFSMRKHLYPNLDKKVDALLQKLAIKNNLTFSR